MNPAACQIGDGNRSYARSQGLSGTFWRFLVAEDRSIPRWIVRDVDSRLCYRDRQAVEEWIASRHPFHVVRDHPYHSHPILACSFGGGRIPDMRACHQWQDKATYGDDEKFLAEKIWPRIMAQTLVHDCCHQARFGEEAIGSLPPREFGPFIGALSRR